MNVGDLFQELSSGELRNLYMGAEGVGELKEADKARVVVFANRALSRLFTKFVARRLFVDLVQIADRKVYAIRVEHAQSDTSISNTAPRYLIDTSDDPFTDRLIKVIAVRPEPTDDVPCPENVLINDSALGVLKLLSYDKLSFAEPVLGASFELELQMDHPKLSVPPMETERLEIPPALVEALQVKIAADVYGSMNGVENTNKSAMLDAKFEALVRSVEEQDLLQSTTSAVNDRLLKGGFR